MAKAMIDHLSEINRENPAQEFTGGHLPRHFFYILTKGMHGIEGMLYFSNTKKRQWKR